MKQDIFVEIIKNNTIAMNNIANAVKVLNDNNEMHYAKEDTRDTTLREVVASNKTMGKIFYLVICALIVLAGAQKTLEFIKL